MNGQYTNSSNETNENYFCRIRLAFEAIFRKSATLQDVDPDPELGSGTMGNGRRESVDGGVHQPMLTPSPAASKKVQLVRTQSFIATII